MKMFFRSMTLLAMALVAGCGGGGDGAASAIGGNVAARSAAALDPQAPADAVPATRPAPSCSYEHLYLTARMVRVRLQVGAGEAWHDISLPQPRQFDLLHLSSGVLDALRTAPLPAGRYLEVRLMLASEPMANAVQLGGGALMPLSVPGGAQNGLKLIGNFEVPSWRSADILLEGFDPCTSVVRTGNSGAYQLISTILGRAVLLPADQEHRINADELFALPGGGFAEVSRTWSPDLEMTGAIVQRHAPDGGFAGAEIRIARSFSWLTPLTRGEYLMAWLLPLDEGPIRFGEPARLMAQLVDATGTPLGLPYQAGVVGPLIYISHIFPPTVPTTAALTGGGFALLWGGHFLLGGPGATSFGPSQAIDFTSPGRVIALASGGFLVVSGYNPISAVGYTADGAAAGPPQFVGAAPPTGWLPGPWSLSDFAVSPLANGGAVVVWTSTIQTYLGLWPTLNVRRVADDGSGIADPVTIGNGARPLVAGLDDGGFVVSWLLEGHVYAARFAADGMQVGAVTRMDSITSSLDNFSLVATGMGGFLVSWTGVNPDGQWSRYGRLFGPDGLLP